MRRYFMSKGVKMAIFGKLTCYLKKFRLQFESAYLLIIFFTSYKQAQNAPSKYPASKPERARNAPKHT